MVRRGDVYYADLQGSVGSEQGGIRPVVIVQNDKGNRFSRTLIVAPVSTKLTKPPIPTHVMIPSTSLQRSSMILLEQLRTIDKQRLGQWICSLDQNTIKQVNKAILISLGLEHNDSGQQL